MQNSKFTDLLKTLTPIELRWFVEYVHSPIFNKHERLIKLIDVFYQQAPSYIAKELDRKNLFSFLFPREKYKEQKISDLISYLVKLLEEFVAYLRYKKQPILQKQYLLTELRERALNKSFQSVYRALNSMIEASEHRDEGYYHQRFLLETESDLFFMKKEVRSGDDTLQKKVDNLDFFYLSVKLKNFCEMINRKNIISTEYNLRMMDDILNYLENNILEFEAVPAITIYYKILLTLTDSGDEIHYTQLKEILAENALQFSMEEARQMYDYAQNYCIKKINRGNTSYSVELFNLYKLLLENKIIFEGKYLSQWDYKNIVSTGLRLEEFKWTEKFIEDYKEKIFPEFRNNAYVYNRASYFYSTENYGNALKLLQKVEFTDLFYHLGSKSMLLKMYYELDEDEPFYSLVDTFNMYLKRNKLISHYQYEVHFNLIKFSKKTFNLKRRIAQHKKSVGKKEIENLKVKINATQNITNLQWLKEKVGELCF